MTNIIDQQEHDKLFPPPKGTKVTISYNVIYISADPKRTLRAFPGWDKVKFLDEEKIAPEQDLKNV